MILNIPCTQHPRALEFISPKCTQIKCEVVVLSNRGQSTTQERLTHSTQTHTPRLVLQRTVLDFVHHAQNLNCWTTHTNLQGLGPTSQHSSQTRLTLFPSTPKLHHCVQSNHPNPLQMTSTPDFSNSHFLLNSRIHMTPASLGAHMTLHAYLITTASLHILITIF